MNDNHVNIIYKGIMSHFMKKYINYIYKMQVKVLLVVRRD